MLVFNLYFLFLTAICDVNITNKLQIYSLQINISFHFGNILKICSKFTKQTEENATNLLIFLKSFVNSTSHVLQLEATKWVFYGEIMRKYK